MGFIDGVTTNPALMATEQRTALDVIKEIVEIVDGPISVEVVATETARMVAEARHLASLHENIVVKLPAIPAGFEALNIVTNLGIKVNFTMIYTANQALLAAKLGTTYVSPFVGRLDVTSTGGVELIEEIVTIYDNYGFGTQVLAASMRNSIYVKFAALAGAHAATIPPDVLKVMIESEMSQVSLDGFLEQWETLPEASKTSLFDGVEE
jgi:transaldolase